ncbi:MAG: IclR family transcriptional regulator [Rhodoglobus sp.]
MQVVIRALSILKLIGRSPQGLSLTEISAIVQLPITSAHRTLADLESEDFVRRSQSNHRYFLGPAASRLSQSQVSRQSPLVAPHPAVTRASVESGETVFLAEFSRTDVVCLALAESRHALQLFVRVGHTMPLHAAAAARVLLAWKNPETVRELIGTKSLVAYTADTPTTTDQVLERLTLIRQRGYDVCDSELDNHVWAVSAPVHSSTNEVVASVTLVAPDQRMATAKDRQRSTALVLKAAASMSADLGFVDAGSRN